MNATARTSPPATAPHQLPDRRRGPAAPPAARFRVLGEKLVEDRRRPAPRRDPQHPRPRHPRPWGERPPHRYRLPTAAPPFRPDPGPRRRRRHENGGRHRLLHGRRACAGLAAFHPARVRSLTLSGSGWSPHGIVDEYRKWYDVLAAKSDTPEALKALIESVPRFTGLPAETIAALPMPLTGSSARSTTNAPTWSASPRSAPISAR
jgi:hypothetical protein